MLPYHLLQGGNWALLGVSGLERVCVLRGAVYVRMCFKSFPHWTAEAGWTDGRRESPGEERGQGGFWGHDLVQTHAPDPDGTLQSDKVSEENLMVPQADMASIFTKGWCWPASQAGCMLGRDIHACESPRPWHTQCRGREGVCLKGGRLNFLSPMEW